MKHTHLSYFSKVLTALVMLIPVSCKKESPASLLSGKLTLNLGVSVNTYDVYNQLKAANLSTFIIAIYNQQEELVEQYNGVNEIPEVIDLPEGSYYATAHSNNNLHAEFDNPYYFGRTENFTIVAGQTTSASITCTLANIMVTIVYSETILQDFSDYSTSVSNLAGSLVFGMNESRAGFFDKGPLHIESNLYYLDGSGNTQNKNLSGDISNPETGKHYEIHIDASLAGGNAILNLNVDENYETEIVLINDEPAEMSGELLITEIMFNPLALVDSEGEYIEVKNVSDEVVNLMDLVIRRGSTNAIHVITDDLPLIPGEVALLGNSEQAAANVDYVYSAISLVNSGDEIYINTYGTDGTNGSVICMVDYGAAGFITSLNGASIQLNPGITDVNDAQLGANWCKSTSVFSTGDYGTPGTDNDLCQ